MSAFIPADPTAPVRYGVDINLPEARFATLTECMEYATSVLAIRPDADVTISNEYVL